ncbi:hypothetical protein Ae706Ps2_6541 [Pseudonocardia sp. Ae706_Ps2]|nr:hypothetical protein Ae706Ps2_6519 [Pseudonocardia sp. Ae706_Ps2]OLM09335.1 hypothetical protein Ae706Ps2_6528 [Pseudonocardia sp. Ae706_Ps2]OLM09344.1 hypothetical protein Ae706Ps2_6537 [Pseudonocardia sp. Ae706_Ps2]OLM09348.1 hypothetical protein Ae706Ps2_6541 [Pseudonocardia sp. Ae706_Ps2]
MRSGEVLTWLLLLLTDSYLSDRGLGCLEPPGQPACHPPHRHPTPGLDQHTSQRRPADRPPATRRADGVTTDHRPLPAAEHTEPSRTGRAFSPRKRTTWGGGAPPQADTQTAPAPTPDRARHQTRDRHPAPKIIR